MEIQNDEWKLPKPSHTIISFTNQIKILKDFSVCVCVDSYSPSYL